MPDRGAGYEAHQSLPGAVEERVGFRVPGFEGLGFRDVGLRFQDFRV